MRASNEAIRISGDPGRGDQGPEPTEASGPKVVYVQAPVLLGRLIRREDDQWWVTLAGAERRLPVDSSVDPALLDEASGRGARVLIDQSDEPVIVGVVATQRSLVIDEEGEVDARVERFRLTAAREVLLRTPGAFVRAKAREVEVFGNKVLSRGRELAKMMAAVIELN